MKPKIKEDKPQEGKEIKKKLPEKNRMTSSKENTATQTEGLNQERITRDDQLPSDSQPD